MTRKRPTSFDVAKLAGVSRSTVSFVLNRVDTISISTATREKVLAAAKTLGYSPFAAGRTLASGQAHTLGLIIGHSEHLQYDAFISQMLYGLNQVAHEHGFNVIVEAIDDPNKPGNYLELAHSKRVDGLVILNPRHNDRVVDELIRDSFPTVLMGASEIEQVHMLSGRNNALPAQRATEHLIRLGHTRIAHISYGNFIYQGASERLQGYKDALESAGISYNKAIVREGNYSAESGFHAMASLLEAKISVTALFASNDTVALGAMAALRESGLRIPEDVAVVGYDDIPIAAYAAPPLTTIRSPALEHGRLAGSILIKLIKGEPSKVPDYNPNDYPLIIRKSCGQV